MSARDDYPCLALQSWPGNEWHRAIDEIDRLRTNAEHDAAVVVSMAGTVNTLRSAVRVLLDEWDSMEALTLEGDYADCAAIEALRLLLDGSEAE